MKETCVISFGDSNKYRVTLGECKDINNIEEEVKNYLEEKFPQIVALPFYSQITIERKDAKDAEQYPVFDAEALKKIQEVLNTEVKDTRSVDELNNNAPFSNI